MQTGFFPFFDLKYISSAVFTQVYFLQSYLAEDFNTHLILQQPLQMFVILDSLCNVDPASWNLQSNSTRNILIASRPSGRYQ